MRIVSYFLRSLEVLFILFVGILLLILSLQWYAAEDLSSLLTVIYETPKLRLVLGVTGAAILVVTGVLSRIIFLQIQKERTIVFRNPEGEVSVALEAIEEFIKKVGTNFQGIRDIRPSIKASSSGIFITIRATLWADTRIPEITEGLQNVIRSHVHDILGVEEPITIHVHVGKLVPRTSQKGKETVEEKVLDA